MQIWVQENNISDLTELNDLCKTAQANAQAVYERLSQAEDELYKINAMDGNNNSFPKHLRQPCKERRSFGMDVHHIVFSKCAIKCRKCGGADCSKSP